VLSMAPAAGGGDVAVVGREAICRSVVSSHGRRRSSERWDCYSWCGLQPTLIASLHGLHIARKPLYSRRWPGTARWPWRQLLERRRGRAKGAGAVPRGRFCARDDVHPHHHHHHRHALTSVCVLFARAAPASAALAATLFVSRGRIGKEATTRAFRLLHAASARVSTRSRRDRRHHQLQRVLAPGDASQ
jgi:hypothetical protein